MAEQRTLRQWVERAIKTEPEPRRRFWHQAIAMDDFEVVATDDGRRLVVIAGGRRLVELDVAAVSDLDDYA